jgi:class 3 adenylate cyclase/Tfp pilus assembly protein PilF
MHLQSEESSILHQLGSFEAGTGNMKKAREFFETALRLSEKLGNPGESSRTMGALAGILKLEGDYKGADYYYRESLLIAEKIKDQKGMAITYNQLGALSSAQGKNEKALEFFEKSLEIKKDINDRRGIIESLIPMAKCLMESNRDDQASGILIKALKIARDLKLIKSQIIISGFIAELDIKNSNFTKADEGLKYALSCCHELDFTEGYAFIYKTFGKLYQMQNDFEKSHFYISLAIEQYNLLNKLNDIKQLRENLELFDKRNLDCLLSEIDANTDTEKLKKLNIRLLDKYGEDLVVVFTDIVGFTLKTELLSEIDIMKLIRDHDQAAEKIIYKNKGRIVKKIGDSIMACFTDPDMAVKSSAEFVRFLAEYSKTRKDAHKIQVRIGMNSGLVIKKDTDVFGDVVNTAARLSHYGSPNEIIMTKKLAGLLKSNDFPLTDLGECRIRGKKDTVSLFACTAV